MALQAAQNPTKEDIGYQGRRPMLKGTVSAASTADKEQRQDKADGGGAKPWDSVPAPGGAEYYVGPEREVKETCRVAIRQLNQEQNPRFKDFVGLKTGGMDGWSSFQDIPSMVNQETADALEAVLHSKADVATCLRWYGRGLKFRHCIRKVLVDSEIRENVRKSRYH